MQYFDMGISTFVVPMAHQHRAAFFLILHPPAPPVLRLSLLHSLEAYILLPGSSVVYILWLTLGVLSFRVLQ